MVLLKLKILRFCWIIMVLRAALMTKTEHSYKTNWNCCTYFQAFTVLFFYFKLNFIWIKWILSTLKFFKSFVEVLEKLSCLNFFLTLNNKYINKQSLKVYFLNKGKIISYINIIQHKITNFFKSDIKIEFNKIHTICSWIKG